MAECAINLKLPSVAPSSRMSVFPSQKRRDLATLSDIIERLEAARRPPTHTYPFYGAPTPASYGDARTDQLMSGLAAGRSATLGNPYGSGGPAEMQAADHDADHHRLPGTPPRAVAVPVAGPRAIAASPPRMPALAHALPGSDYGDDASAGAAMMDDAAFTENSLASSSASLPASPLRAGSTGTLSRTGSGRRTPTAGPAQPAVIVASAGHIYQQIGPPTAAAASVSAGAAAMWAMPARDPTTRLLNSQTPQSLSLYQQQQHQQQQQALLMQSAVAAAAAGSGSLPLSSSGTAHGLVAATERLRLGSPSTSRGSTLSREDMVDSFSSAASSPSSTMTVPPVYATETAQRSRSGSVSFYAERQPYFVLPETSSPEADSSTKERAAACKYYISQHYIHLHRARVERIRRRRDIEEEMLRQDLPEDQRVKVRTALIRKESEYLRRLRAPIDLSLFAMLKSIGRGAFGQVTLVRAREDNKVYAMKRLRKRDVIERHQVAHVKAERDILAEADNEWVVRLYYSFQDHHHLYFVMDYVPVRLGWERDTGNGVGLGAAGKKRGECGGPVPS